MIVCAVFFLCGCTEKPAAIPVTSVILNSGELELTVGQTEILKATVTPSNADNKQVIWTSSNSSIASVDNGVVTGKKVGNATITVIADDGGKSATCMVKVVANGSGDNNGGGNNGGDNSGGGNNNDDNTGGDNGSDSEGDGSNEDNGGNGDSGVNGDNGNESEDGNVDISSYNDLSSEGTANCYVVSESGDYKFAVTKGNSSTSVGSVVSASVLWESFGTDQNIKAGDLIKSVVYSDGYIAFKTADAFKEGNAVIAAMDSYGKILWSWHIWMTDQPEEHVYNNGAGTLMDRNLGATSAVKYDITSVGLLYQWGRKDPFLTAAEWLKGADMDENYRGATQAASTLEWPECVESSSYTGTIEYAVEHPTVFIVCDHNKPDHQRRVNCDWYYNSSSSTAKSRWSNEKTKYDPCPPGWRVPDDNVWENAGIPLGDGDFDTVINCDYRGFTLSDQYCSHNAWYPACGMMVYWSDFSDDDEFCIMNPGLCGTYWTSGTSGIYYEDGYADFGSWDGNYEGHSVRCQKE